MKAHIFKIVKQSFYFTGHYFDSGRRGWATARSFGQYVCSQQQ